MKQLLIASPRNRDRKPWRIPPFESDFCKVLGGAGRIHTRTGCGAGLDSGNEYIVKAELPGLKRETLKIDVGTNELSLAANSDVEREEKGKTYLHRERAFSTFRRNIGFAESVDTEKASVKMTEGILEIKLPKLEQRPEKKTKRITL